VVGEREERAMATDKRKTVEVVCNICYGTGKVPEVGRCPICKGKCTERVAWFAVETCFRCGGKFANEAEIMATVEQGVTYYGHSSLMACVVMLGMEVGRLKSILRTNGMGDRI
jgi:RecJ-like exonuclease